MSTELCLGTAQFGLDYGITNDIGQIDKVQVKKIIEFALSNGVKFIDTAQDYGNAEATIGALLPKNHNINIISKFKPNSKKVWNTDEINIWESALEKSLEKLRIKKLYGLLLHDPSLFKHPSSKILKDWLLSIKKRNFVDYIGVSIYSKSDLSFDLKNIDIIQLPLSIYDQRLLNDGTIKKLSDQGISVFSSSSFLQGLILQSSKKWPKFISNEFKMHHSCLEQKVIAKKQDLLYASMGFLSDISFLKGVLIGVTSQRELIKITDTWEKLNTTKSDSGYQSSEFSWKNTKEIDPRNWPNKMDKNI